MHLGRVANTDEVKTPFAACGLICDEKRRSGAKGIQGPLTAFFSVKNVPSRPCLLAVMEASQNQCHVLGSAISIQKIGVPMDRGGIDSHTRTTKERLFMQTARPVLHHS